MGVGRTESMNRIFMIILVMVAFVGSNCSDSSDPSDLLNTEPINNPPIITEHNDTTTTVGATIWFKPTAYDPDGDPLEYGGFVHFTFTDIKVGTFPVYSWLDSIRVLEFKPQSYDQPGRKVTLSVIDGRGGKAHTTFYVQVN